MNDNVLGQLEIYGFISELVKISRIIRLPNGKWRVVSKKGKNLGTYQTKEEAKVRLRQVEFFKHKKAEKESISDLTYSSIMRILNKVADEDTILKFQKKYKSVFDELLLKGDLNPEDKALEAATQEIDFDGFDKMASAVQLGDPEYAGRYLADLIKFLLTRISPLNRQKSIQNLKNKIYYLNEYEISSKHIPASASMGQAITLLKNILIEHDSKYIREVLNSVVRHL